MTSARFAGMTRVARHRLVYDALRPLIPQGIHALAIEARSPAEVGPLSPPSQAAQRRSAAASHALPRLAKGSTHDPIDPLRATGMRCRAAIAPLARWRRTSPPSTASPCRRRVSTLLISRPHAAASRSPPELEARAREEVVLREIFAQEAEKRGIAANADYKAQMELVRQTLLIRELFEDYKKKNPVTDAEAKAEYDKFKAQADGHRIQGAPHPGGERRRSQEADHADQGRRQVRGAGQEELARTPARARTVATSTSPSPTPTCPSSARRWSR